MSLDRNGDLMTDLPQYFKPKSTEPQVTHTHRPDTRDLRDPHWIGENIKTLKEYGHAPTYRAAYESEHFKARTMPNYPQDESMGTVAAREYRQELEDRAAAGDKYAVSALQSMDEGKGVVGFDDAG
jgi:hypothetical protein